MKILITGGTGLIGTAISKQLLDKGHKVVYYSREPHKNSLNIPEFGWNPDRGEIDKRALEGVDAIINLAGANLNKRWTPQYKSVILRSRVDGTRLLLNAIQKENFPVKTLISASAVGYYPHDYERTFTEDDPPGTDFLSTVTQKWEKEAQNFEALDIRTVRARIGVVLSDKGGALPEFVKTTRLGLGAPLGNGRQWLPWIHIDDVAGMFVHALENEEMSGPYNFAGPDNVTNAELTKRIASVLGKPLWLPNVPAFALKLVLGEMSRIVLISSKVSAEKISKTGYEYHHPELNEALKNLLK